MNTTKKASGTKRVVRVRWMYGDRPKAASPIKLWPSKISSGEEEFLVIDNAPKSLTAQQIKKLLELQRAVDRGDHEIHQKITDAIYSLSGESRVELVLEALGLTQPRARAGRRSRNK